jgi:amino acid transporter
MLVLGAAGLGSVAFASTYRNFSIYTVLGIVLLLAIVAVSYWQTIFTYPNGGGSYSVTSDNLGTRWRVNWGLVAGGALLIDYVLTVSVSIAAGVQNLANIPFMETHLHVKEHLVPYCLVAIALLTWVNLRGLKESGPLFATVTYSFVLMCYVMIGVGVLGPLFGWQAQTGEIEEYNRLYAQQHTGGVSLTLLAGIALGLQAFSSGCTAMTGVEAVSNGVPSFQVPKSKNAAMTLIIMAIILGTIFLGLSWIASRLHIVYYGEVGVKGQAGYMEATPSVIDQLSGAIFGKSGTWSFAYLFTQFATAGILVLAANTAFADFPRLASMMAKDRYLPKQLANLGDKLVFNNGVVMLGLFAGVLIVLFHGVVDSLIPLYAVGVFLAFTLSQSSMVLHWRKERSAGWKRKATINGIGATATGIVLATIVYEKFTHGAWIIVILICVLYFIFWKIHRHYIDVAHQLSLHGAHKSSVPKHNTVLVLVSSLHRGVIPALEYAQSLSPDCRGLHIELDGERTPRLKERWEEWATDTPLVILHSPYRSLVSPIMRYLDAVKVERKNHIVTVVVPEFVPYKGWHTLLHGNSGWVLRLALLSRRDVVLVNFRYELEAGHEEEALEWERNENSHSPSIVDGVQ